MAAVSRYRPAPMIRPSPQSVLLVAQKEQVEDALLPSTLLQGPLVQPRTLRGEKHQKWHQVGLVSQGNPMPASISMHARRRQLNATHVFV
jgi:hypothetical protein